jgi:hypothetical protein
MLEKEGCDLDSIAVKVGKRFDVSIDRLRVRCRGGKESDARKVFVYAAAQEYKAPSRMIADYCGVGITAVSFMARAGYCIAKRLKIDISLFRHRHVYVQTFILLKRRMRYSHTPLWRE